MKYIYAYTNTPKNSDLIAGQRYPIKEEFDSETNTAFNIELPDGTSRYCLVTGCAYGGDWKFDNSMVSQVSDDVKLPWPPLGGSGFVRCIKPVTYFTVDKVYPMTMHSSSPNRMVIKDDDDFQWDTQEIEPDCWEVVNEGTETGNTVSTGAVEGAILDDGGMHAGEPDDVRPGPTVPKLSDEDLHDFKSEFDKPGELIRVSATPGPMEETSSNSDQVRTGVAYKPSSEPISIGDDAGHGQIRGGLLEDIRGRGNPECETKGRETTVVPPSAELSELEVFSVQNGYVVRQGRRDYGHAVSDKSWVFNDPVELGEFIGRNLAKVKG